MLVSCGGNEKKVPTVKEKAIQLMEKMVTNMEEGNIHQLNDIKGEMQDWYASLSEEEEEKVMEAELNRLMKTLKIVFLSK